MKPLDMKLEQLSPEHRRQVEDFVDFLIDRYGVSLPVHRDDPLPDRDRGREVLENHPIVLPTEPLKRTSNENGREVIYVHAGNRKKSRDETKSDELLEWFE
jgi:hypothetical protein